MNLLILVVDDEPEEHAQWAGRAVGCCGAARKPGLADSRGAIPGIPTERDCRPR